MPSIFEIGQNLQAIINELEENGGELTEELAAALDITQENFENKIESYCQVITMYKSDIDCCKEEKKRLQDTQKVKENTIERLKSRLLDAVKQFGELGKSGNKVINLPTRKLYTTNRESVEENESRKGKLAYYFHSYIQELSDQGLLELGENIDVQIILDAVNTLAKADYETPDEFGRPPVEEYVPYTLADLQAVKFEINTSVSLYDLLTYNSKIGYLVASSELNPTTTELDKDVAKAILKDDASRLTVGTLNKKESLTIK